MLHHLGFLRYCNSMLESTGYSNFHSEGYKRGGSPNSTLGHKVSTSSRNCSYIAHKYSFATRGPLLVQDSAMFSMKGI